MMKCAVHMLIGLRACVSCSSHQTCHEGLAVSKNGLQTAFNNLLTNCSAPLGVEGHFHQLHIIYYLLYIRIRKTIKPALYLVMFSIELPVFATVFTVFQPLSYMWMFWQSLSVLLPTTLDATNSITDLRMMPYDIKVKSITAKRTTTTTRAAAETHQTFRRLQAASKKFQCTYIVTTHR